ncbi:glycosyltransferase [Flavobacterium enshiense]|uniref:glycosyltransferase n=1 Tax=Flavobacterium enshiense TaxID=1341165 RepID=UPI00345D4BE2
MNITIINNGNPIPSIHYGGTERVIWGLGYELHKLGHKVTFIVPKGSYCDFADVVFLEDNTPINTLIPKDTDIVHFNGFYDETCAFPFVYTLHGNNPEGSVAEPFTIFISKNQALRNQGKTFIYNGLLWDDYPKVDLTKKRDYYHFLGKASWKVKNLQGACEIAVKSNNKLMVMGGEKWTWANLKRKPQFTLHPNIKYFKQVNNTQKMAIMEHSKGLIFPVKWHEPFGLAIIESMYAGCPVFGSTLGSLPELVLPEVGFLSNNIDEISAKINTFDFSPKRCHEYALENFNSKKMAENYLEAYTRILDGESLN